MILVTLDKMKMITQQLSSTSSVARTISLAKDVVGKEVIDDSGFKAGRVRDLAVRFLDGKVEIAGVVVHNRFVPWQVVKSFGLDVYLNTRWFALGCQPIPGDAILVCQHLLGERILDAHGRHVGHVDDIGLTWDATAHELRFENVLTGPYLSIGISQGSQQIPWSHVIGIKQKPRAVVVKRF
jgi:sporulation protein YlmC with PRC-barrel domain